MSARFGVTLDLRVSERDRFDVSAYDARRRVRKALDGLTDGDVLKIRVTRWTLPSDVLDLIPAGVAVQIDASDASTARKWESLLEAAS